jgi:PAS domain S-box-containing protein
MPAAPLHPDEQDRLEALHELGVLDTRPEERFDRITRVACALFDVPIALVSLVDANRQWFKSCVGIDVRETPRAVSFCAHAILGNRTLVIPDTTADERFAENPFVTGEMGVRFYAGRPLMAGGHPMGTLCLIDRVPRELDEEQLERLDDVAGWAEHELGNVRLVEATRGLQEREAHLRTVVEHVGEGIVTFGTDGRLRSVNRAAAEAFGAPAAELAGRRVGQILDGLDWPELAARLADGSIIGRRRLFTGRRGDGSTFPFEAILTEAEVDGMPLFIAIGRMAARDDDLQPAGAGARRSDAGTR